MSGFHLLKKAYILIYKMLYRFVYRATSMFKTSKNNKVVIALHRSKELEGNLKFIHEEIIEQLPNAKIHLVAGENKMNLKMFKEAVLFADATYLILDDYYLPVYLLRPNRQLKVIQLWHAAGAFKKFGYSTIGTKFGPDKEYLKVVPIHSNYTHVYVSSGKCIPYYSEAFNMTEENIFPFGVPRIDFFNDKRLMAHTKEEIFSLHPHLEDSTVIKILFAPTYRAKGNYSESKIDIEEMIVNISAHLNSNIQILYRAHPYIKEDDIKKLDKCENVTVVQNLTINDWMIIADAFVTDFSSSIFEFSLLKKPLAHFVPDEKEYTANRGLYQTISSVSDGDILKDEESLIRWLNNRKSGEYFDTSRMIHINFDHMENVSRKIVNHFIH